MRSTMYRWLLSAMLLAVAAVPALAAGRGMLGVTTQSTDEDLRRGLDLKSDGLLVSHVSENGPADRAGLRKGDVILTYNSRSVTEPVQLRTLVRDTEPGRRISLGIWRDGDRRTLEVTVGELSGSDAADERIEIRTPEAPRAPRAPAAPRTPRYDGYGRGDEGDVHRRIIIDGKELSGDELEKAFEKLGKKGIHIDGLEGLKGLEGMEGLRHFEAFAPSPGRGRLGVRVERLNDDLAQALGASGNKGVLVVEVVEDTPAQKAGIRAGDVIVRVGTADVDSPDELVSALSERDAGDVELSVLRKGARLQLHAELDSRGDAMTRSWTRADRPERTRIVEPGRGNRVYRWNTQGDSGSDEDLREELRQLKQELRELRDQLKDKK